MGVLCAGVSKGSTYTEGIRQTVMKFASIGYYRLRGSKKTVQSQFFLANPDLETARMIWGMADTGFIKKAMNIVLPSVRVNKCIQIPRHQEVITL